MLTECGVTASTEDARVLTWATLPLYIGGLMGPFGTMVVISIYPELRETFDADNASVTWAFSGYLLAMAALLLVSGTIGERLGRRRVTRATFIVYAIAAFAAALAPTLGWFIGLRIVMGAANAFITPLLIAGLSEVIPPNRLGRAIGVYAAFQAAGGAVSPFVSGVVAEIDWRWSFVIVGAVASALALRPAQGEPRPAADAPPIRPLFQPRMIRLWVAALTAAAGPVGLAVIIGVRLRDGLGVSSSGTGTILLASGLVTMVASARWGSVIDRVGGRRASTVAIGAALCVTAPLGLFGSPLLLVPAWILAATLVGFIPVNLQRLAAVAVPENRGGALSSVLAFRFIGHAIGPLIFLPILDQSPGWTFAAAASLGVITLAGFLLADPEPTTDPAPATRADPTTGAGS